MTFKEGSLVSYNNKVYIVKNNYKDYIQIHTDKRYSYHHGTTIPKNGKHYKQLRLYLPEILKKL